MLVIVDNQIVIVYLLIIERKSGYLELYGCTNEATKHLIFDTFHFPHEGCRTPVILAAAFS